MATAYEVYAFWNGTDIYNALNATAAIMGGGDYLGLMKAVGLVGLLAAVTFALLTQKGQTVGTYFMGFVFVYGVIFVPKASVIVNDVRSGTTQAVSNVPLGLAVTYATISHIGYFLTLQYEARFTSLDDERFSKSGMVFGARVLETLAMQDFPDPAFKADVMTFYKDCIVPELIETPTQANTLKNSKDLATALNGMVNPGRGTVLGVVSYAGSSAMSCSDVMGAMTTYITNQNINNVGMGKMGRIIRADQGTSLTTAVLQTTTQTDVSNMLTNLMGISDTAQTALAQSMWINGVHDADMALRNGYGNAQTASYSVAVTEQSSRQAAYTGKLWSEKALPLIRNIAEFVLISAFPLVFIIMLVAGEGALKVLKLYLTVLTSLALWAPFTAILNSLVINNGKQAIQAMIASGGGITLENVNGVIDLALQQQALAGQLFLAVPMIAYALVSAGAQAATSAVGGLTASAPGAAGQVGGQVAQGNVSGGQVGWRNVNAFNTTTGQSNTAMSDRSGFIQQETGAGTMVLGGGAPGGGTFNGRTSQLGSYQASLESGVESGFKKQVDSSMSASRSSIASALESIRSAKASGFKSDNASKAESSFKAALETTDAKERSRLAAEGAAYAAAAATEATASKSHRQSLQTSAGGSIGLKSPGGSGAQEVGGGLNAGVTVSDANDKTSGTAQSNRITGQTGADDKNTDSTRNGTSDNTSVSSSATNSASNTNFTQSQFEKAKQFGLQGQAQAQQADQASEQLSASRTDRGGIKTDLSNQVVAMLGGAAAAQQLYGSDQKGFGAAVNAAAESIIAARALGPGDSKHFAGVSGGAPVSTDTLNAAQDKVDNKVAGEIGGAPKAANLRPETLKNDSAVTGGASPAVNKGDGKPAANPFAKPATPPAVGPVATPTTLVSPTGQVLNANQVVKAAKALGQQIQLDVSNKQAENLRRVANNTEQATRGDGK
jgi:conjugal transfer mating pair stabilization protein TraG